MAITKSTSISISFLLIFSLILITQTSSRSHSKQFSLQNHINVNVSSRSRSSQSGLQKQYFNVNASSRSRSSQSGLQKQYFDVNASSRSRSSQSGLQKQYFDVNASSRSCSSQSGLQKQYFDVNASSRSRSSQSGLQKQYFDVNASSRSRSSQSGLQKQYFDVNASLQRALQVLSSDHQIRQRIDDYHSHSITVHPRSSFLSNHGNNYTALTLSRLVRDRARVNSLHSSSTHPKSLSTPLTSGLDEGSGEYFAQLGVGQPVKQYLMVLDTGSDITWLQCQPCVDCYIQSQPIYNPVESTTYTQLPCSSPRCTALENPTCSSGKCMYEVSYSDDSYTTGNFVTETLSFGSSGHITDVAIGCGHDNAGLYSGAAGLMGLGGGTLSLPSQINASSFSYCLVNRDSNSLSTLDFNSARLGTDSVTTPLLSDPEISTYRFIGLTGISVGGKAVRFSPSLLAIDADGSGGVIVDSGTTVTRLIDPVYDSVRDTFRSQARKLPYVGGFSILDTCYDFSGMSSVSVPTVSFQFSGGGSLELSSENYLIPVDDMGTFCFAFAGTNESPSIIGNVQQQEMRITYDLAKKIIVFTPNQC